MDMQEAAPKEFEKKTEVLPFTKYGLATSEEFKKAEEELQHLEQLKRKGLTSEEVKLYLENEAGLDKKKIESNVLDEHLKAIYAKIELSTDNESCITEDEPQPSTSSSTGDKLLETLQKKPLKFYPEGHPIHELNQLKNNMFGHLNEKEITPIDKRRKVLRRLERKERYLAERKKEIAFFGPHANEKLSRKTLWDVREYSGKEKPRGKIGPKRKSMYTIRDNKIVRLDRSGDRDAVVVNEDVPAEVANQLLEGTKMSVDDIRKIDRFRNYEPGEPSKILYLKNIAQSVTQQQISLLFNQFVQENQGPVYTRLLTGRMRGQAFAQFNTEDLAIQALDDVNGTIVNGNPVIVQFGRNGQGDNR